MAGNGKNELTIALDGEVTPRALAEASAAFAELLDALLEENARGVPLHWVITDLHHGSGNATAELRAFDKKDAKWVPQVIQGGKRFAEEAQRSAPPSKSSRLTLLRERFARLPQDNDRLTRVRLETADSDFLLAGRPRPGGEAVPQYPLAFGSVTGRVQAMSNRGSLRFTLYDLNDDKAVSCYLDESKDAEREMLDLWGKVVEVEGYVRRDPVTDRPLYVRGIAKVNRREVEGSWREALGAAAGFLGEERSEDVIRRIRDE